MTMTNRRPLRPIEVTRLAVACAVAAVAILALVITLTASCKPAIEPLDAAQGKEILQHVDDTETKLANCRTEGRDAGSFVVYEDCKRREGLK